MSTDNSKSRRSSLEEMGEALKRHLERYGASVFVGGSNHYLITLKEGDEARDAWAREGNARSVGEDGGAVRVVYRMMGGVYKKDAKTTFPWTSFCFRPAVMDLGEGGGAQSFLNLQAINNVSNALWAMVRVHDNPCELCVYVGRHIPHVEEVIEPQLRLPLTRSFKLKADGALGAGGLFSDNPHIGKALQVSPLAVDLGATETAALTLKNISAEPVTVCELGGRGEGGEELPLDGVAVSGVAVGDVLAPGEERAVEVRRASSAADEALSLAVGYAFGDEVDLEAEGFLGADEEVSAALQGEEQRVLHAFLAQGHAYDLIRLAFAEPRRLMELSSELVDITQLFASDSQGEADLEEPEPRQHDSILLNAPDFFGNSVGTVPFTLKTGRPAEQFAGQLSALSGEEVAAQAVRLTEQNLVFEGQPAAPAALVKFAAPRAASGARKGQGRGAAPAEPQVNLDLVYLGHLLFYNDLSTPDHAKMRDFFLNCVGLASLIRAVPVQSVAPVEEP